MTKESLKPVVALHRINGDVAVPGDIFLPEDVNLDRDELLALGAIGEATEADIALFDKQRGQAAANEKALKANTTAMPVTPALVPHHRGGGRFDVRDAAGEVVSGETVFHNKADAEAFIAEQAAAAPAENLLG